MLIFLLQHLQLIKKNRKYFATIITVVYLRKFQKKRFPLYKQKRNDAL